MKTDRARAARGACGCGRVRRQVQGRVHRQVQGGVRRQVRGGAGWRLLEATVVAAV